MFGKFFGFASSVALSALVVSPFVLAEDAERAAPKQEKSTEALWELGAGVAFAGYPDFRGSDEYNFIAVPIPIVVYRGDWLRVSRDEARARLFDSRRFDINITGGGSIPTDSDSDNGREGVPDLDPTFSIGPSFDWILSDPENSNSRLRFRLPVQAAFVASFSDFETLGVLIQPQLVYNHRWQNNDKHWSASLRAGPLWATTQYHNYFYTVDPAFATADRRAFEASGGYSGLRAGAGVLRRQGRLSLGSYVGLDYLEGARFDDSPLVATRQSYIVGAFVSWQFWESEERAPLPEPDDAPYD